MAIGTFEIRNGAKAAFAVVELDVQPSEGALHVHVARDAEMYEGEYYVPAVTVGIRYALNRAILRGRRCSARVEIRRLLTTTVDSGEMLVVFAAAQACLRAMGYEDADAEIDWSRRRVSFNLF